MKVHVDWGGPNQEYRYTLWRIWDDSLPYVQFIGLNPSTADEHKDDPTIRRCVGFARSWGYGAICMTNLFAWRDTKPEHMKKAIDPIGPENDSWLVAAAQEAGLKIAAWGNHGAFLDRAQAVCGLIGDLHALTINKATGEPGHPLYVPSDVKVFKYDRAA